MIDPTQLVALKGAVDLVDLVSQHALVKKIGARYVALCPFHSERSPSFSINPEMGVYYCFGCKASGDAITFVREIEGASFEEAVLTLGERAGVHIDVQQTGPDRRPQYAAMEAAAKYYQEQLRDGPLGVVARRYLQNRGITQESIEKFGIGIAPPNATGLIKACRGSLDMLSEIGLIFRPQGKPVDPMAGRIVFPVRDHMGRCIAFSGRVLSDKAPGGKYINTRETDLFHKSQVLYGLDLAKREMVKQETALVVEGQLDVVHLHQAGQYNVVAPLGTALGDKHMTLLGRFVERVVLVLDGDLAGRQAVHKVYKVLKASDPRLDVACLPEGKDPADLEGQVGSYVEQADSACSFLIDDVIAQTDVGSPEGKAGALREAIAIARAHPDPMCRTQYAQIAADRLHLPLPKGGPAKPAPAHAPTHLDMSGELPAAERSVLQYAVHRPAEVVSLVHPVFFAPGSVGRRMVEVLWTAETVDIAIDALQDDEEAQKALYGIACDPPDPTQTTRFEPFVALATAAAQRALMTDPITLEVEQVVALQQQLSALGGPETYELVLTQIAAILE